MNVYQLIDSRNYGGIEAHLIQLYNFLKEKKINVKIILIRKYKINKFREILDEKNIEYKEINNLFKFIKNNKKNSIFHSHGYKANIINKLIKIKERQDCICSYHSSEKGLSKTRMYTKIDYMTAKLSDFNIAISNEINKEIKAKNKKVIYNFLSGLKKINIDDNILNISFIGRISKEKNIEDFISISKVNNKHKFNIFGEGSIKKEIIKNCKNIKLWGFIKDQETIWKNTDILLITSHFEGLPYTLIEAMNQGKIIISYEVGEIPYIIENNKNGFLAKDIHNINIIINKLKSLNIKKIKRNAKRTFNQKLSKKNGNEILKIYLRNKV